MQLDAADLKRTADAELLEAAGAVARADAWRRQEVRTNTRLMYTQHKCDGEGGGVRETVGVARALARAPPPRPASFSLTPFHAQTQHE